MHVGERMVNYVVFGGAVGSALVSTMTWRKKPAIDVSEVKLNYIELTSVDSHLISHDSSISFDLLDLGLSNFGSLQLRNELTRLMRNIVDLHADVVLPLVVRLIVLVDSQ